MPEQPSPARMADYIEQLRAERKMLRARELAMKNLLARLLLENEQLKGEQESA